LEYKVGDIIWLDLKVIDVKGGPGKSGFGIVYVCYSDRWKQMVAVKSFQDQYLYRGDKIADKVVEDFYHEAETWMKLGWHLHIVNAVEITFLDYKPHILLEYVDGGDLKERLEHGPLGIHEALHFAIQFCDGMIYANSVDLGGGVRGIVHRDIKPSNIMLKKGVVVALTDFGLVKALGRWRVEGAGTPEYMSPEQFETVDVDTRSDIYSFGVVLYEMLCGRPPFYKITRDDKERWMFYKYHHQEVLPRPTRQINPSVPEKLELVVMKCLEKNPIDRYQNFEALRGELAEIYRSQFGENYHLTKEDREFQRAITAGELYNKGLSFAILGKPEEAIPFYDRALEINPKYAHAWVHKGLALESLRKFGESLKCFDKALEIDPRHAHAWAAKGYTLISLGRHEEAQKCFERALEINPREATSWWGKGRALASLGKDKEGIICYDRALELDPRYADAFVGKGLILISLGRHEEASKCFDKALEINPRDATAWAAKGKALVELGKHREAIECFERALQINPRDAETWRIKGVALAIQEKFGEALKCFDRALEIDPGYAHAWAAKMMALVELGKYEEAQKCFRKAVEINPGLRKRLEAFLGGG